MKTIGIKLADGSFYPIMQDGQPAKKTLGLTTVNDNQTRVLVDVYRSKTGTMEDAEYIDSLQIDNLVEHPNGTADIHLNIGLDENNKLSAEMIDPETGATSNANITLVSRTLEERLSPTNYELSEPDADFSDLDSTTQPEAASDDFGSSDDDFSTSLDDMLDSGTSFDAPEDSATTADFADSTESDQIAEDDTAFAEQVDETDGALGTTAALGAAAVGSGLLAAAALSAKNAEQADSNSATERSLGTEENPLEEDAFTAESTENSFDTEPGFADEDISVPVATDAAESDDTFGDDSLPDFSDFDTPAEESTTSDGADPFGDTNTDFATDRTLSDTTQSSADDDSFGEPSTTSDDTAAFSEPSASSSDDDPFAETATPSADATDSTNDSFGLPDLSDFDSGSTTTEPDSTEADPFAEQPLDDPFAESTSDATETASSTDDDFDLPDFPDEEPLADNSLSDDEDIFANNDDDIFATDSTAPASDDSSLVRDNTPSNGINFAGLYDEETVTGGTSDSDDDDDDTRKKTRVPVIICIVCAIICVLATLLILFVVPSKYNLLNKSDSRTKADQEEIIPITAPEEPIAESEPEPEPEIIEAKEEEVVVVAEPEKIVPEPAKEPEKPAEDITYKIKWGDTLWDIADSYYNNPWNYKKIARYNNIRNPDYIISGTYIKIPAK